MLEKDYGGRPASIEQGHCREASEGWWPRRVPLRSHGRSAMTLCGLWTPTGRGSTQSQLCPASWPSYDRSPRRCRVILGATGAMMSTDAWGPADAIVPTDPRGPTGAMMPANARGPVDVWGPADTMAAMSSDLGSSTVRTRVRVPVF